MRRIVGALLLTWCTYRLVTVLATRPGVTESLDTHIARWWPLVILAIALVAAARALRPPTGLRGPVVVALIGAIALMFSTGLLHDPTWGPAVVPLALLPVGWLMATSDRGTETNLEDWPALIAVGVTRRVASGARDLTHGRATAVLGGLVLDLRACQTVRVESLDWTVERAGHGALLDVNAIICSIEILVPPTWLVQVTQSSHGGAVDNRVSAVSDDELTGRLQVAAFALAGQVVIRTSNT